MPLRLFVGDDRARVFAEQIGHAFDVPARQPIARLLLTVGLVLPMVDQLVPDDVAAPSFVVDGYVLRGPEVQTTDPWVSELRKAGVGAAKVDPWWVFDGPKSVFDKGQCILRQSLSFALSAHIINANIIRLACYIEWIRAGNEAVKLSAEHLKTT